jgi:hypothetical protein
MLPKNGRELFCRLFVSEFEKLLVISQRNMIDKDDQLRPTEHGHVIVIDTEAPEGPIDTHHKVGITPINAEKLYDAVKSLWMFILVLTEMSGDGGEARPRKAGRKLKSVLDSISHDFALQSNFNVQKS